MVEENFEYSPSEMTENSLKFRVQIDPVQLCNSKAVISMYITEKY